MATYVISIYRPGYLSEGEPYCTSSLDSAVQVLVSEVRETIDSIADDGEFLDAATALHVADVDTKARKALQAGHSYYYDAAGYRHAVEIYPL